ncbi:GNAT family N-acetyltransferase [Hymenobacter sp. B81]|uniref:GNAT family N-acetyltransferase n=1 Tax=Hymenobacter sp. B81 TaxID=3344878 RepID=UPI0037DDCC89
MLPAATQLPPLNTPRLRLRWLTAADVPALYAIFSDPQVLRYWGNAGVRNEAEAAGLLADIYACFAARTLFQWGVARATDDQVIGTCTLSGLSAGNRRADIGYALGTAHWGQGYMHEALPELLRFAFGPLDLHRLVADVDPRNHASIRSLERLGFRREGYQREQYYQAGEWQDAVLYGLLRREAAPELRG